MKMISRLESLVTEKLEENKIELVDIQYRKEHGEQILRVFIDTESGVNMDTCSRVTRFIQNIIEEQEDIPYDRIEVSSPGIDRILKKDGDFERFSGQPVKIKTSKSHNNQKNYAGILRGLENDNIKIEIEGQIITLPREIIATVRLYPDI